MMTRLITFILALMLGCSTPVDPDAATADDAGVEPTDAGTPPDGAGECELDAFEPDDLMAWTTFEAMRVEGPPAFLHTWRGTWATEGFFDVDRVRVHVRQDLAVVVPEQVWTVSVTGAREVQLDVTCEHAGAMFVGCRESTLVDAQHCRRVVLGESATITGLCSTGNDAEGAMIDVTAWQEQDAPCERLIRVELSN